MSRPGTGLLDSGQGKTAEKGSLCVKPEGGEGTGPADIWEESSRLGQQQEQNP